MKKLLAPLIAGFIVTGAFAQAPAAPVASSAKPSTEAAMPSGEGTKGDIKKTTPKAKHVKHAKKHADTMAK